MRPNHLATLLTLGVIRCVLAGAHLDAQPAPTRWSLDTRPLVTLDGEEPAAILETVTGATRLPDGTILVADHGDYALRIFNAAGAVLKRFGRKGSGPGEVRYLARMWRCGDSVYTYDIEEGHRLSVFTLTGQYVRTFRFGPPPGEATPFASACNRRGDFVHLGWEKRGDMKAGIFRSVVPVWTSRADSVTGRIIDSIPGSERWGLMTDNQFRGTRPLPLGKQPVLGIAGSTILVGSADRFLVRMVGQTGQPLGTLQRPSAPLAVTPSDVQYAIDLEVANSGENNRPRIQRAYAAMTFPKTLPAYTTIMVDANDLVWVRPYPRGAQSVVRWSVFDTKGALVAEVDLPTLLEVYEIGNDYVLGRYLDPAMETPQVRMYRLNRRAR